MKPSIKIKARRRIERGCNFPSEMSIMKYPGGTLGGYDGYFPFPL